MAKDKAVAKAYSHMLDQLVDCDKLTNKQKDFIVYYLDTNNATQAYLKAFDGESKKTARIAGSGLLKNPAIASTIRKLRKAMMQDYEVHPSQYVEYLLKVAHADLGDFLKFSEEEVPVYGDDGLQMIDQDTGMPLTKKVNKMHLVDSETVDTSTLVSVKQGRDGISIQMADKAKAWDKLAEYFGWFNKTNEATVDDSGLLNAIQGKVEMTWDTGETIYGDLEKTLSKD